VIRKEPSPDWPFYRLLSAILLIMSVAAFIFGDLIKIWPNQQTSMTVYEAGICFFPVFASRCTALIVGHGGIAPAKIVNYQLMVLSPLIGLIGLWGFILWFHSIRIKVFVVHNGLTVGGINDLLAAARREQESSQYPDIKGLHFFNGWHLSLNRETLHFNVIGATGGGKTLIIIRLIYGAVERQDKAIVFDHKGDYTALIPPANVNGTDHQPIILAPQDARSHVWDIAADLEIEQDAIELATRLIPEERHANSFFSDSARAVLAACIVKLMDIKPKTWTWKDLLDETRQDNGTLLATTLKYSMGASRFMEADHRQVMSTLSSLETRMGLLNMLAAAWPSYAGLKLFSIRRFLSDATPFGTVIVRHDGQFSALSDAWISSLFAIGMNTIKDSKTLSDDPSRRIWMFLDEWAQLPKIDEFPTFITVGRTKGVCVVMGLQDVSQISEKYGQDALQTIMASVGTSVIVHVNHGATALALERMFGRTSYSHWTRRPLGTNGAMQWCEQHYQEEPFKAPEFSQLLFADNQGVRALISGLGDSLYKVLIPMDTSFSRSYRKGAEPASWTTKFTVTGKFKTDAEINSYINARNQGHATPRNQDE